MAYQERLYDNLIGTILRELPALALEGAKAVGKTSTANRFAKSMLALDDDATVELLQNGPAVLKNMTRPVCLDEWQRLPKTWDYVRRIVDDDYSAGQFLLTGSAAPVRFALHSGAGRISSLRMRPLSLQERRLDQPILSLNDALTGKLDGLEGQTRVGLGDYLQEIGQSGFPAIRMLSGRNARVQLRSYVDYVINKEFPEQGQMVRKPQTLRNWMKAYAAATASTASYQTILKAATPGEQTPAKTTAMAYRDVLDSLWLIDRVEAWLPTVNPFTRLAKAPKHYLADPALAAVLLGVNIDDLLTGVSVPVLGPQHGAIAGRLFEALVALSLQTYALVNEAELGHFRSVKGDHEIDFILERNYHLCAIEVKMADSVGDDDCKHLLWLQRKLDGYEIFPIVVYAGRFAYRRKDGVFVVPAVLLGA
ncbi:MAG: DUF4143 domain-containing protein [Coriobacteriales bacterium]|nr:DUF4143 domain-containing protein [Coriobacteriales bacterium]